MRIAALFKKELGDMISEKVYVLAFFVQLIIVIGLVYTALLYTSIASPQQSGFVSSGLARIGVTGSAELPEFRGLQVVKLDRKPSEAADVMQSMNLVALLIIPENFKSEIEAGRSSRVLLILDNTNVLSGYADAEISRAIQEFSLEIKKKRIARQVGSAEAVLSPIRVEELSLGSSRGSADFVELMYGLLIPFILLLPVFLATNMTTDSIVGEKEKKTYEALVASPLSKVGIILGKTLPIIFVAVAQSMLWAVLLEVRGIALYNILALLLLLCLLSLIFVGFGLIVSAYSDDIKDANVFVAALLIVASLAMFAPLSLKNALSPVPLITKLASTPGIAAGEVIPIYALLLFLSLAVIYSGARLLERQENLRL